jgi:hypothetical protein
MQYYFMLDLGILFVFIFYTITTLIFLFGIFFLDFLDCQLSIYYSSIFRPLNIFKTFMFDVSFCHLMCCFDKRL